MEADRMAFFHEGTMCICGTLDTNEMLAGCYAFLKRHMPLKAIMLNVYDPEANAVINCGAHSEVFDVRRMSNTLYLSDEARRYIETQPEYGTQIHNPSLTPVARDMVAVLGVKFQSVITSQLNVRGQRLGVVAVASDESDVFVERHAEMLGMLSGPFSIAMSNTLRYREVLSLQERLRDDNTFLRQEMRRLAGDDIVGEDYGLRGVMEMVNQVSPLNSNVLLLGETGVGKEVVANAIHYRSPRRSGPMIKVNCGAIPEGIMDSELFGHEKGAFTGAFNTKRGRFELADGGTLFMDEVGELTPAAQIRLLRVLQTREIERVGGAKPIPVDVRIIAATHRNLEEMVNQGRFREDLWFRLNVFPITIPPLRQRTMDIPALVAHFIERKTRDMNLPYIPVPAPGALEKLRAHSWPGNVRELENAVEREMIQASVQGGDTPLRFLSVGPVAHPAREAGIPEKTGRPGTLDQAAAEHIRRALSHTGGRVQGPDGAAALLGVNPSTLRHRMRKLGVAFGRETGKGRQG